MKRRGKWKAEMRIHCDDVMEEMLTKAFRRMRAETAFYISASNSDFGFMVMGELAGRNFAWGDKFTVSGNQLIAEAIDDAKDDPEAMVMLMRLANALERGVKQIESAVRIIEMSNNAVTGSEASP